MRINVAKGRSFLSIGFDCLSLIIYHPSIFDQTVYEKNIVSCDS